MAIELRHKFNIGDVVRYPDDDGPGHPHVIVGVSFDTTIYNRLVVTYRLKDAFLGTIDDVDEDRLEPTQVAPGEAWYVKPVLEAFGHAAEHCWQCDAHIGSEWPEKCPECGADTIPF